MPTKDPIKNMEYVEKSRAKLRSSIGDEAYKKKEADERRARYHKQKARELEFQRNQVKSKVEATRTASNMINDLFKNLKIEEPVKKKVGRPRKQRNPVGRPKKEDPVDIENLPYKEKKKIYMRNYMRDVYKKKKEAKN